MDEVMVLGDSLNDYSMLSMDFGATVAMENAVPGDQKGGKIHHKEQPGVWCGLGYRSGYCCRRRRIKTSKVILPLLEKRVIYIIM